MFDRDEDGFLSRDELMIAVQHLMDIRDENTSPDDSVIPEHVKPVLVVSVPVVTVCMSLTGLSCRYGG